MENIDNCWILPGGECCFEQPSGYVGFTYKIIFPNKDGMECYYIGKKVFEFNKKRKISKREKKLTGTLKRIERVKTESDWLDYFGSSTLLDKYIEKRGGTHGFKRYIINMYKDKWSLTYGEVEELVKNRVLFDPLSWNINILSKFFKQVPVNDGSEQFKKWNNEKI